MIMQRGPDARVGWGGGIVYQMLVVTWVIDCLGLKVIVEASFRSDVTVVKCNEQKFLSEANVTKNKSPAAIIFGS